MDARGPGRSPAPGRTPWCQLSGPSQASVASGSAASWEGRRPTSARARRDPNCKPRERRKLPPPAAGARAADGTLGVHVSAGKRRRSWSTAISQLLVIYLILVIATVVASYSVRRLID